MAEVKTSDIILFVHEWGKTKFTKGALYKEVASVIIGCQGFWYPFPSSNEFIHTEDMIEFLYAVRKFPSIA